MRLNRLSTSAAPEFLRGFFAAGFASEAGRNPPVYCEN
jgi:hypothetical protein